MTSLWIERGAADEGRQTLATALTAVPGLGKPLLRALDSDRRI